MLQHIRDNIQGTIAKIIIGLIIIPFVLFGVDSFFGGGKQPPAAVINGEKIPEVELRQAIEMQKRQLLAMMGRSIDPSMLDDSVLRQPSLQRLIRQKILLQTAAQNDLYVSDGQLNQSIVSMPQFSDGGRFSQQRYEQILRTQGLTSGLFKQLLGNELLISQLSAGVSSSSFLTPFQQEQAVRLSEQKRSYHYIRIPADHFLDNVQINDEEIAAYYNDHQDSFKTEESVQLSYIELLESDFFASVDEALIRAEYDREVEAAKQEAQRRAAHILVEYGDQRSREQAEARIAEIQNKLKAGESFADLAKNYSDDFGSAEQGGDLGFSTGDTFPANFETALGALDEGEVSGVVETEAGLHLIELTALSEAEIPAYEKRRPVIEKRLQSQQARPKLIAKVEELKDMAFNAADLSEPAKALGLEVKQSVWLTPSSEDGILADKTVKQAAFDSELRESGHNSDVFELAPDHFLVLRPKAYKAPEIRPLAAVSGDIESRLKQQKAAALAQSKAAELEQALRSGAKAEELAKKEGLEWQVAVRSGRQDASIEESVRTLAFNLPRPPSSGGVVTDTLIDDNSDRVVIQLSGVFDGDAGMVDSKRQKELFASALRNQSSQLFGAYFSSVINGADIKIIN